MASLDSVPPAYRRHRVYRARALYYTLLLIALLSPWGDLIRLAESEKSGSTFGITSLAGVLILAIGALRGITWRQMSAHVEFTVIAAVCLWGGAATMLVDEGPRGLIIGINVVLYVLIAATLAGSRLSIQQNRVITATYALSAAAMCAVSLVDYFKIVDVPRVNESLSHIDLAPGMYFQNLVGPYYSYTALSVVLSMAVPLCLYYVILGRKGFGRSTIWIIATGMATAAAVLTLSRNLIVSCVVAAALLSYKRLASRGRFRILLAFAAMAGVAFALQRWFPLGIQAIGFNISRLAPSTVSANESDMLRWEILAITMRDLMHSPWGLGFSQVDVPTFGLKAVHSNVTLIVRAVGIFSIPALVFITVRWYRLLRSVRQGGIPVALVSFAIYGISHTNISTLFAWCLLGMAYAQAKAEADERTSARVEGYATRAGVPG